MSFDDQIRAALDGTTASLREHLEAQLRAFAQEAVRVAGEERQQALKDRQQAVTEASEAVAAEVRAQAEVLVADVRSQAEAQVAHIRAAAQKHAEELKRAAETQIAELRKALEDLRAQAQQQLDTARRIAQAEIEKAHAEIEKARAEADKVQAEADKVHAEADKARAEAESARAEAESARAEAQSAHAKAESARVEVESARAEAESTRAEAESARAEAESARAAAQSARAEAQSAHSEAQSERAEADVARAETEATREDAKQEVARAQAEIDNNRKAATAEAEDVLIARLTAAHVAGERKIADAIDGAHTDSHQSELSRAARLADAIRNLDEARGLSEVLERLVQCSGHEVDRAAVLLVKGDRLAGWRLAGFAPGTPPAKSIDLSVEEAGLAGAVLRSGVAASRPSDATHGPGLPPFAVDSGERHAMALPVWVGGEVVAVLYADAPRLDEPSSDARWPAILEVLVRHASRVLEAMTVQQAAGLSLSRPMARGSHAAVPGPVEHAGSGDADAARRYARLLLSEIRMYHEPIVDAGRRSGDLMSRLRGEIERARKLYEARVPESVQARAEYFDQELVSTLAGGDQTLLGSAR